MSENNYLTRLVGLNQKLAFRKVMLTILSYNYGAGICSYLLEALWRAQKWARGWWRHWR